MKLLLTSSGISNPSISDALVELLGKPIAVEEGMRFAIREGGRTVGAGVATKVTK